MKQITLNTALVGREDTFKMLAVAQATEKPILLIGVPGTAKTRALLDYALAFNNNDPKKTLEETFILETDESTRGPEITGRPDLRKIVEENTYDVITPIADSKFILINEIDKASAGLRNAMLSIMNERVLFNGAKKVKTPWEVFCSSCNVIPSEEKGSPFWDRFVIKHEVKRITKVQLLKYYSNGSKKTSNTIMIPEKADIAQIVKDIPESKLKRFLDVAYNDMSDRTLSYIPEMTAAIGVVYQLDLNQSLIKTAQILGSQDMAKKLAETMEAKEVQEIRQQIENIASLSDYDDISKVVEKIKSTAKKAASNPDITKQDLEELANVLNSTLQANPNWGGRLDQKEEDSKEEDSYEVDSYEVEDSPSTDMSNGTSNTGTRSQPVTNDINF